MVITGTHTAEIIIQDKKLLMAQRMAKARTAKACKRINRRIDKLEKNHPSKAVSSEGNIRTNNLFKSSRGRVIHLGERGAKFYINVNGNRTYLSSNQ